MTARTEIRVRGRSVAVPSIEIGGRNLICTGKWLSTASIQDEAFVEGEVVPDPILFIAELREWHVRPDIFMFCQKITDPQPKFPYFVEWDDFAAIPITSYTEWYRSQAKKDVKENVRRAKREGVVVRPVVFDDSFVSAVKELFDETPIRQGKPFWHYQKPFELVKELVGTYKERAEFIGAYLGAELIGFLKMVYVGDYAKTMHVMSKERHHQKRPTNALIAKAVEICEQKKMSFFIYGEYNFPGTGQNSLTEFKRRHGFQELRYPRYFVPLTAKGRFAISAGVHSEGLRNVIPAPVVKVILAARAQMTHLLVRYQQAKPSANLREKVGPRSA